MYIMLMGMLISMGYMHLPQFKCRYGYNSIKMFFVYITIYLKDIDLSILIFTMVAQSIDVKQFE
jgi:hypothetical protein